MFLFRGITVESSAQDDHFPKDISQLVLELKLGDGLVKRADLLSRKSSPGVWDANKSLILAEVFTHFTLSVFLELDEEVHQLLASKELYGPDLYDRLGEPADIPLGGHENYLDMILRTTVFAVGFFRETPGGGANNIDNSITQQQDEASLIPDDHPDKPRRLSNLAHSFFTRFERLGNLGDLDDAIARFQAAANLLTDDHPDKPKRLSNLGNHLLIHFEHLKNLSDINEAIGRFQVAVILAPDSQSHKRSWLTNLGGALRTRFEQIGDLDDINDAITHHRAAVNLTPDGDPYKPKLLTNLGISLETRFQRLRNLDDINDAIEQQQAADNLTPDGHPDKPDRLNSLGGALLIRFRRLEDLDDINNAIAHHQAAVNLTPDHHPHKPNLLNNLGVCLGARFQRIGNVDDIDNAIERLQMAVNLTPDGHPDKPGWLTNLGGALGTRFERLGNLDDIDDAIAHHQATVNLTPDGHPDRASRLGNLGSCLRIRFNHLGNLDDINNAIVQHQTVVNLTPDGHPEKPSRLSKLGSSLGTRFQRLGNLDDINNAIAQHQAAVDFTPDGHPDKPSRLCNIGSSLLIRFQRLGNLDDLNCAIAQHQVAVGLTPDGHPSKPNRLSNLGCSFGIRFERLGNLDDIDNAIERHQMAVNLTPDGHPDKPSWLTNLGISLLNRFQRFHHSYDAEACIIQLTTASLSPLGPPSIRLIAAREWIDAAAILNHTSLLAACGCAINIIPLVAWLGLSISDRHHHLVQIGSIVRDVAAIAISLGECDKAFEWLEQGRSIVWSQILQLRTPVDRLRAVEPDLADRLLRISSLLHPRNQDEDSQSKHGRSSEEEGRQYRALAKERDEIVEKVWSLPGFHDFLKPLKLSSLAEASKNGPVVVINVSEKRCDALALVYGVNEVIHVPLPDLTSKRVTELQIEFLHLLKSGGVRQRAIRDEGDEIGGDEGCKRILAELWDHLVKPVLDSLAFKSNPDTLPRMWWCVTGPLAFLPIHAAGVYDTGNSGGHIQDYAISSYVPTISALLGQSDTLLHKPFRHLSAIEPSSGASYIPNTEKELEYIRRRLQNRDHVVLHKADATKERVMKEMRDCNWLHLACHGTQNPKNPIKSALLLHGGKLTLEEIIRLDLPHAEFAFLSACQTMMGDEGLSEEAVHIAGGMSLAGYQSVVATMWSIEDALAPKVADEFYARLLRDGERPDNREAAEALHFSVKKLREEEKDIKMLSWLPFVHLGI
ncbi:hypothetical protein FRC15_006513 [Serendipita sp. 397]|nr:hypothetical protein FRC15_006513 [Serendipita sp. 397]